MVRFRPELQEELISDHGTWVTHQQGQFCSCSPEFDPGRALSSCKVCLGLGVFWRTPGIVVHGLLTRIEDDKSLKLLTATGAVYPSDLIFSQSPYDPRQLSTWDRIIMPFSQPSAGDFLIRDERDKLKYQSDSGQIDFLSQIDPDAGVITEYYAGVDYVVESDQQTITWQPGQGPATGSSYTAKYRAIYEYIVFNSPNTRFDIDVNMGQKVLLRRKWIAFGDTTG